MTRVWTILLLLLMAIPTCAAAPGLKGDADRDTDAIKVGFVYNFTRFIRWPPTSAVTAQAAFVIAVVGDPTMYRQLTVLENNHYRVDDRPVRVERVECEFAPVDRNTPCPDLVGDAGRNP